jgi:hypothetical protein
MGIFKNILTELFYDIIPNNTSAKPHRLFEDIVGYDDIKELFGRALSADNQSIYFYVVHQHLPSLYLCSS